MNDIYSVGGRLRRDWCMTLVMLMTCLVFDSFHGCCKYFLRSYHLRTHLSKTRPAWALGASGCDCLLGLITSNILTIGDYIRSVLVPQLPSLFHPLPGPPTTPYLSPPTPHYFSSLPVFPLPPSPLPFPFLLTSVRPFLPPLLPPSRCLSFLSPFRLLLFFDSQNQGTNGPQDARERIPLVQHDGLRYDAAPRLFLFQEQHRARILALTVIFARFHVVPSFVERVPRLGTNTTRC